MNLPIPSDLEAAEMAIQLEQHPGYRVLRRLVPRKTFQASETGRSLLKGVVLDTETTGLNADNDKLIELGMVFFVFDPQSGTLHNVLSVFDELEDPGIPIPPETTAIHHITDDMVRGKRIDDKAVETLLKDVSVVIAHNASFDRPFVENRWPVFETKQWACSIRDINWKAEGMGSAKLEYLLQTLGIFYDAHRAETDCWALLELLNAVLPQSQQPALLRILETLNQPQFRLYAIGSPFDSKDVLKARGYRWDPDKRCWHRNVSSEKTLEEEIDWLKRKVYTIKKNNMVHIESLGGTVRYSTRQGELAIREI